MPPRIRTTLTPLRDGGRTTSPKWLGHPSVTSPTAVGCRRGTSKVSTAEWRSRHSGHSRGLGTDYRGIPVLVTRAGRLPVRDLVIRSHRSSRSSSRGAGHETCSEMVKGKVSWRQATDGTRQSKDTSVGSQELPAFSAQRSQRQRFGVFQLLPAFACVCARSPILPARCHSECHSTRATRPAYCWKLTTACQQAEKATGRARGVRVRRSECADAAGFVPAGPCGGARIADDAGL